MHRGPKVHEISFSQNDTAKFEEIAKQIQRYHNETNKGWIQCSKLNKGWCGKSAPDMAIYRPNVAMRRPRGSLDSL